MLNLNPSDSRLVKHRGTRRCVGRGVHRGVHLLRMAHVPDLARNRQDDEGY